MTWYLMSFLSPTSKTWKKGKDESPMIPTVSARLASYKL